MNFVRYFTSYFITIFNISFCTYKNTYFLKDRFKYNCALVSIVLSKKEKEEIGLIIGSVLLVAIVGIILVIVGANKEEAIVGSAISSEIPTPTGVLVLMNEHCEIKNGGICNEVCAEKTCFPVEANCDVQSSQCLCCDSP